MSYGASTQSKWVLTLSAAISGDGPEANRPPHSGVAAVGGPGTDADVAVGRVDFGHGSVGPGVHGRAVAGLLDGLLELLRLLVGRPAGLAIASACPGRRVPTRVCWVSS